MREAALRVDRRDDFQSSLMAAPASRRLLFALSLILCLWAAVAWAVALA